MRPHGQNAVHEEIFRALHASALHACVENWQRARDPQRKRRSHAATMLRIQHILRHTVRQRWRIMCAGGQEPRFLDTWLRAGAIRIERGQPEPVLLGFRHVPPAAKEHTIIASGDGAGPSETEKGAGAGGVLLLPARNGRPHRQVHLIATPVVCTPGAPGYRGAARPTNNAAELTAIADMADAVRCHAHADDHAEIHSDSALAILAALGVRRRQRGGKRAQRARPLPTNTNSRETDRRNSPTAPTNNAHTKTTPSGSGNDVLAARANYALLRARQHLETGSLLIRKVKGHSGDPWNEVADATAAVARTLAIGEPPQTAEVIDRLRRALEAEGGDTTPDVTWHGFAVPRAGTPAPG